MNFVIFGIELGEHPRGDMRKNSRQALMSAQLKNGACCTISAERWKGMAGGCSEKPVWESCMNLADGFVESDCTSFTIFLHKTDYLLIFFLKL